MSKRERAQFQKVKASADIDKSRALTLYSLAIYKRALDENGISLVSKLRIQHAKVLIILILLMEL